MSVDYQFETGDSSFDHAGPASPRHRHLTTWYDVAVKACGTPETDLATQTFNLMLMPLRLQMALLGFPSPNETSHQLHDLAAQQAQRLHDIAQFAARRAGLQQGRDFALLPLEQLTGQTGIRFAFRGVNPLVAFEHVVTRQHMAAEGLRPMNDEVASRGIASVHHLTEDKRPTPPGYISNNCHPVDGKPVTLSLPVARAANMPNFFKKRAPQHA